MPQCGQPRTCHLAPRRLSSVYYTLYAATPPPRVCHHRITPSHLAPRTRKSAHIAPAPHCCVVTRTSAYRGAARALPAYLLETSASSLPASCAPLPLSSAIAASLRRRRTPAVLLRDNYAAPAPNANAPAAPATYLPTPQRRRTRAARLILARATRLLASTYKTRQDV